MLPLRLWEVDKVAQHGEIEKERALRSINTVYKCDVFLVCLRVSDLISLNFSQLLLVCYNSKLGKIIHFVSCCEDERKCT